MNWLLRGSAVPVVGALLFASLPSAALATDTPEQVTLMASSCANCHGTDGRLAGNIPALAGVSADQLEAKLLAFKHDEEVAATIMDRIAKGFSDAELAALASHFAAIDPAGEATLATTTGQQE